MPPSFGSMERISIHALREEGDWPMALMPARALHFYPRPPRGGRRALTPLSTSPGIYFYPRPPRGGRRCRVIWVQSLLEFLSTPSARRATR